jgi:hypothetical protein
MNKLIKWNSLIENIQNNITNEFQCNIILKTIFSRSSSYLTYNVKGFQTGTSNKYTTVIVQ